MVIERQPVIKSQPELNDARLSPCDMRADMKAVVACINGSDLTLGEFVCRLKLCLNEDLFDVVLKWCIVEAACDERNIVVVAEELQACIDDYRSQRDLFTREELQSWLFQHRISEEELRLMLTYEMKLSKLAGAICEDQIEKRYALAKAKLHRVELYTIQVERESMAEELRMQVDEGADFFALARLYSQDEDTRKQCGYMGVVRLSDLASEVESCIVGRPPGEVIGPIKSIGSYHLYLIERVIPSVLDEETQHELKQEIFEEWLELQMKIAKVYWQFEKA